jgi:1,4-dihydroxy-6-naphthoate synthase
MQLTLGFSPCPNDTFIFDALVNGKIDTRGLTFDYILEDVETLNRWASARKLDITKLSYSSFLHNVHHYALLHSGSALGQGVGPLLIQKANSKIQSSDDLNSMRIAIPGLQTTANLLLTLAHPEATNKTEVLFSEIEDRVMSDEYDCGLVIHESRFTYAQRGLAKIMDLGDWWESTSGTAVPLGGIVIRRSQPAAVSALVDTLIRESILYSWKHYPELAPFVTANAQEMDTSVMRQHIGLYVNKYTADLGETGELAIKTLFDKASKADLIQQNLPPIFY